MRRRLPRAGDGHPGDAVDRLGRENGGMRGERHGRTAAIGRFVGRVTSLPELPAAGAALLGFAAMVETVLRDAVSSALLPAALLLAVCATAPVALLRSRPVSAAVITTAAVTLTLALYPRPPIAVLVAEVATLYLVGRRRRATVAAWFTPPFVVYALLGPPGDGIDGRMFAFAVAAATIGATGAGAAVRVRAEAAVRDESSQAMAKALLAYAARGERARIARELHDVVAHHISMIAVQAETARLTTPDLPPDGAKRLLAIGDTARAALTEMRRLLGVLRDDTEEPAVTGQRRTPQPGLRQLTDLLDEARNSTGAGARLLVRGRVIPLDPGVQLTTYRIVQEALTNVRRHAPGAAVDVELAYTSDALRVRVRDNGPGLAPGRAGKVGHGLLGMRERVATVNGELWTGSTPNGGGFLVDAVLPLPREATPVTAADHRRAATAVEPAGTDG
ncbi:Histidine kinase-, DNA gyrase B-, and HSP90-like ATPase [Micromonospora coriariae]|uniref:histidine kinase n=2 Tax=Micromonospora coriariae TaxID=285665 RepID=A0A1C4X7R0_9ACTN|nr:Histidine kinase-, DNA gyrase B-, and HSP90-like ATPase [Micromonospora coriariae]